MSGRVTRGLAVLGLTLPAVLLAHLLTTGLAASLPATLLAAGAVAAVAGLAPACGRARLAGLVTLSQLLAHGLLAWQHVPSGIGGGRVGCLGVVGRGAELGLRLAVLRGDASCPPGTLTAGETTTAGIAAVLSALAVLVGHALAATLTAAALDGVRLGGRALARLARLVLAPARRPAVTTPAPRTLRAPAGSDRPLRSQWAAPPPAQRGPPPARTANALAPC